MVDSIGSCSFSASVSAGQKVANSSYLLHVLEAYLAEMVFLQAKLSAHPRQNGVKYARRAEHLQRLRMRCAPFLVDLLMQYHGCELPPSVVEQLDALQVPWRRGHIQ